MKFPQKVISLLLVVLLLGASAPAVYAVNDASEEPGKTAVLTFQFKDVYSVSGVFTIIDPNGIISGYEILVADAGTAKASVEGTRLQAVAAQSAKTNVTAEVRVLLMKNAPAGKSCTVSFSGVCEDANDAAVAQRDLYQSAVVTVKETAPAASAPADAGQSTVPAEPEKPKVDYTALNKQITIANGLNPEDYTAETAQAMKTALANAKALRKSTSQSKVNTAAAALSDAIAKLVKLDYSRLQQALTNADSFSQSDGLVDLWQELEDAVKVGKALLASGDQAAIDAGATHISDVLAQIQTDLETLQTPKIVEVEVPVEVLPEGDFCNITSHRGWMVAAIGSLGVNVALVGIIVSYVIKKKRYDNDDTPLVNYDIGDDM